MRRNPPPAFPLPSPCRFRGPEPPPTTREQVPRENRMLNVFTLAHGRLVQQEIESLEALAHVQPVWVDLEDPGEEEKRWIETRFAWKR